MSSEKEKSVSDSVTTMSQLMMPDDSNFAGFVHGGSLLSIADKVAYVCATRHAGKYCVTASVDSVHFRTPVRVGSLVTFIASVNWAGRTSMEVGIRVTSEEMTTGEIAHTNSCYFTMVAVDKKGTPAPIPSLLSESEDEVRRMKEAIRRREFRLKERSKDNQKREDI